jgi:TRAP-type C4-dicarboxylate transport system permease small subunit
MTTLLHTLAKACALLGGALLVVIALLTCGSLIGRNTIGVSLVGDFELTAAISGAVIALFLPLCQLRRTNIIVDFFTAKASPRTNEFLDRFGTLLLAVVMAVLAWRSTIGGLSAYANGSGTMMLGFPDWIVYSAMVPGMALTAAIAAHQVVCGFGEGAQA